MRLVAVTDEMLYAAAFDELVAFDVHTHAQVWQQPLNTYYIVKDSGTLYITYSKGNDRHEGFAALDARTGKILWQKVNSAGGGANLAGIVNGVFYGFGVSNDGKEVTLYALFANTGAVFWTKSEGPFSQWGGMAVS